MQIHQLKRNTPNKKAKKVGRGGKRGKTSGKGHKGQNARAGRKLRPEMRDIIKKIPKKRGYGKNRARTVNSSVVKPLHVNLAVINRVFSDGDKVTVATLIEKKVIDMIKGRKPRVKILGTGGIVKKVSISGCAISENAKNKIEKAGGSITE